MPHCESCHRIIEGEKLFEDKNTNELLCSTCAEDRPMVSIPHGTLLGRDFDYDVSYSRKDGLKASATLGKASLSLHIPQEEIVKVIG